MSGLTPAPLALAPGQRKPYLPVLTGVRAVAAYMVCFFHYNHLKYALATGGWLKLVYIFLNELNVGVNIFFVLSGFLIYYRCYETAAPFQGQWLRRYLQSRFARIYPLYFLLTLLTFGGRYASSTLGWQQLEMLFLNLTLLKGFAQQYHLTGILQAWSLTVEACFYVSAPFLFISIRRSSWAWAGLPAALALVLAAWWALGELAGFSNLAGSWKFILHSTFFGRFFEFFTGMALAARFRKWETDSVLQLGWWRTLLGAISFSGCLFGLYGIYGTTSTEPSFLGIFFNNVVVALAIALLLYGLLTEHTWLRSLLSTKLVGLLGRSSYALYLIHLGVLDELLRRYTGHHSALHLLLLSGLAIALYKTVELPLHALFRPASPQSRLQTA